MEHGTQSPMAGLPGTRGFGGRAGRAGPMMAQSRAGVIARIRRFIVLKVVMVVMSMMMVGAIRVRHFREERCRTTSGCRKRVRSEVLVIIVYRAKRGSLRGVRRRVRAMYRSSSAPWICRSRSYRSRTTSVDGSAYTYGISSSGINRSPTHATGIHGCPTVDRPRISTLDGSSTSSGVTAIHRGRADTGRCVPRIRQRRDRMMRT